MSPATKPQAASSARSDLPQNSGDSHGRSRRNPAPLESQLSATSPETGDDSSNGLESGSKAPVSQMDIHKLSDEKLQKHSRAALAALVLMAICALVAPLAALLFLPVWINATVVTILVGLVTYRIRVLLLPRQSLNHSALAPNPTTNSSPASTDSGQSQSPSTQHLPAVYMLYVLGSGGHTTEMVSLIRRHLAAGSLANMHRRYVYTSGDTHSPNAVRALETAIRDAYEHNSDNDKNSADGEGVEIGRGGTFDAVEVTRARRVHQPFWTSPFSSLRSALDLAAALTLPPTSRRPWGISQPLQFRYPHVVVTNGPGTGFVVAAVAWLLKLAGLVPADRLRLVYVETWAHVETLSLTGKLFHLTGLADVFCVQHRRLAERYGKLYVDLVS